MKIKVERLERCRALCRVCRGEQQIAAETEQSLHRIRFSGQNRMIEMTRLNQVSMTGRTVRVLVTAKSPRSDFFLLARRVIEWVKFAKKCCSYEFHPP